MQVHMLSHLTNDDYISIRATLHAIDNREFYCHSCLNKYANRPDAESMTQRMRELKGCFSIKEKPIATVDELKFYKCVGNFFRGEVLTLLEMQGRYERGILPYPGSLSEQPNKLIECFSAIDNYKQEKLAQERKRIEMQERGRRGR
jgi:hypothetical protein